MYRLEEEVAPLYCSDEGDPIFERHVGNDRDMADTMRRYMEGVLSHGLVDGMRGEVLAAPLVEIVFVSPLQNCPDRFMGKAGRELVSQRRLIHTLH